MDYQSMIQLAAVPLSDAEAVATASRRRNRRLQEAERRRIIAADQAATGPFDEDLSWREKRAIVWDRCRGRCCYCGVELHPFRAFTVDHVVPRSRGGSDELDNLVGACRDCNAAKGSMRWTTWRSQLRERRS